MNEYVISITNGHDLIVGIRADGTLNYGDRYDPDEAARHFWHAVLKKMPLKLKKETVL